MRIRETIVAAGFLSIFGAVLLAPSEAAAQTPPVAPLVARNSGLGLGSNITMAIGVGIVTLMPRVYYNDPEATVGWKGRWHFSVLAPAMTMTALTLMVDGPIRNAIKTPRPGCTIDNTSSVFPGSNCETFGMPSTQAFASFGASGAGAMIFVVDTLKYSNSKFSVPGFIGNVALPLSLSIVTAVLRGIDTTDSTGLQNRAYEDAGQMAAGAISGFVSGALVGLGYTLFQRPNCGYGGSLFCW
jgi:hypothetical protein